MRAAKGAGSIMKNDAGYRGYITIDGKRKYFTAKTKAEAEQKRRELLHRRDQGSVTTGRVPTIEAWIHHWINEIAELTPSTRAGYLDCHKRYIVPTLGHHTLDKLKPEHLEQLYGSMRDGTLRRSGGSTNHFRATPLPWFMRLCAER